ncbi:hypothetical protein ACP4OV_021280 [Aristida adscensionis]
MQTHTDLLLDLNAAPRPSRLLLPTRIARDTKGSDCFHDIIDAHPSGRLLVQASPGTGMDDDIGYFVCDARTRTARRLPEVPVNFLLGGSKLRPERSICIAAADPRPGREEHYIVVQLHPTVVTTRRHTSLLCYTTESNQWNIKPLASSPDHEPWSSSGVVLDRGMLWWVDVAHGMLGCDPFAERPRLVHVPLPDGSEMIDIDLVAARSILDEHRFVRPSSDKLRYVEIGGICYDPAVASTVANNPEARITMWTFADPQCAHPWEFEYQASFAEICNDESYTAAGLSPEDIPVLGLVDPKDHHVIYLFQKLLLFALDVRARRVLACRECLVDSNPQHQFQSSRFVHAWVLPPSLVALDPSMAAKMKELDEQVASQMNKLPVVPSSLPSYGSQFDLMVRVGGPSPAHDLLGQLATYFSRTLPVDCFVSQVASGSYNMSQTTSFLSPRSFFRWDRPSYIQFGGLEFQGSEVASYRQPHAPTVASAELGFQFLLRGGGFQFPPQAPTIASAELGFQFVPRGGGFQFPPQAPTITSTELGGFERGGGYQFEGSEVASYRQPQAPASAAGRSVCWNWRVGSCSYGNDCWFAHSDEARRIVPAENPEGAQSRRYKAELCRYWLTGNCTYGANCYFAHGSSELRPDRE